MNTPVRIIVYIIALGVIGWLVWRYVVEPKMDTATAPAVETTPAPTEAPPASPEPAAEPAAGADTPAKPDEPSQP